MPTLAALLVLAQAPPLPERFLAPVDAWVTAGGGVSRSGAARATSVRAPIEVAWSREFEGAIEGEPRVWDGAVYVGVRRSDAQRELHVLDLASGRALARPLVARTPLPLEPAVWDGALVYRSTPDEITAVRARDGVLRPLWTHRAQGCAAPLASESGVYIASRDGLFKHALVRPTSTWRAEGVYLGGPVLGADDLLVLEDDGGVRFLRRVNAQSGARRERAAVGELREAGSKSSPQLAAFPSECFVQLEGPLLVQSSKFDITVLGLGYSQWREDRVQPLGWSPALLRLPAWVKGEWVGALRDDDLTPVLAQVRSANADGSFNFVRLASAQTHRSLLEAVAPATVAGELLLLGPAAIDMNTNRIAWRAQVQPSERAVPTLESVLFVDAAKRLVAVRSKGAVVDRPLEPARDLLTPGVLVLRNGKLERGDFRFELAKREFSRGAAASRAAWSFDDVALLADRDSIVQCGAAPLRGIELVARAELGEALLELAGQARSSGDEALLSQLIDEAAQAGADDAALARLEQYRENAAKSRNKPTRKPEIVAQIQAQHAQLGARRAQVYWRFWEALLGPTRLQLSRELLQRTLVADPKHAAAREHVLKLVPVALRPAGEFDALDALELADIAERTALRVRTAAPEGEPRGRDEELIAARAKDWRADLISIASANVQILTPKRGLGALARCLAHGEAVCAALESLLGARPAGVDPAPPLLIELYESRDAYLAASQRALAGGLRSMEHTRGHYDPDANVSRFYLEAHGTVDDELLEVAAHELTHHWLRARAPRWEYRPTTRRDVEAPGYWLVEGFACVVQEFGFDSIARTWAPGGRDSENLDLVAHAPADGLIPWERLFALSYAKFDSVEVTVEVPLSLQLGAFARPSGGAFFYAQAEAAAHYLFTAQDGALRPKLFEALENYYAGRYDAPALPALLGVEASELGARIQAHAKATLE